MNTKLCRHFNGIFGPGMREDHVKCTVGQSVDDYRDHDGRSYVWGCMNGNTCSTKCSKFDAHTQAECDEDEKMWDQLIKNTMKVRKAIGEHWEAHKKSVNQMMCPICAKALMYRRAAYNGHVHAKCETDGCVSFME